VFNSTLLGAIQGIVHQMKMEHQEEIAEVKSLFDSKFCSIELKLMESMISQSNFDIRLCALEQNQQDTAAMKTNFESRLSLVEAKIANTCTSLSQVCGFIGVDLDNRLRDVEAVIGQLTNLQGPFEQHKTQREKDVTTLKANLADNTSVTNGSFDAITDLKIQRSMDQHRFDQQEELANFKLTLEHRFRTIESDSDVMATVLKNLDPMILNICGDKLNNN